MLLIFRMLSAVFTAQPQLFKEGGLCRIYQGISVKVAPPPNGMKLSVSTVDYSGTVGKVLRQEGEEWVIETEKSGEIKLPCFRFLIKNDLAELLETSDKKYREQWEEESIKLRNDIYQLAAFKACKSADSAFFAANLFAENESIESITSFSKNAELRELENFQSRAPALVERLSKSAETVMVNLARAVSPCLPLNAGLEKSDAAKVVIEKVMEMSSADKKLQLLQRECREQDLKKIHDSSTKPTNTQSYIDNVHEIGIACGDGIKEELSKCDAKAISADLNAEFRDLEESIAKANFMEMKTKAGQLIFRCEKAAARLRCGASAAVDEIKPSSLKKFADNLASAVTLRGMCSGGSVDTTAQVGSTSSVTPAPVTRSESYAKIRDLSEKRLSKCKVDDIVAPNPEIAETLKSRRQESHVLKDERETLLRRLATEENPSSLIEEVRNWVLRCSGGLALLRCENSPVGLAKNLNLKKVEELSQPTTLAKVDGAISDLDALCLPSAPRSKSAAAVVAASSPGLANTVPDTPAVEDVIAEPVAGASGPTSKVDETPEHATRPEPPADTTAQIVGESAKAVDATAPTTAASSLVVEDPDTVSSIPAEVEDDQAVEQTSVATEKLTQPAGPDDALLIAPEKDATSERVEEVGSPIGSGSKWDLVRKSVSDLKTHRDEVEEPFEDPYTPPAAVAQPAEMTTKQKVENPLETSRAVTAASGNDSVKSALAVAAGLGLTTLLGSKLAGHRWANAAKRAIAAGAAGGLVGWLSKLRK